MGSRKLQSLTQTYLSFNLEFNLEILTIFYRLCYQSKANYMYQNILNMDYNLTVVQFN